MGRVVVVERFYDCTSSGEEPTAEEGFPKGGRILLPGDRFLFWGDKNVTIIVQYVTCHKRDNV